jgi:TRAP-type mannitol/chloroaromatic compound transport system permease small subunit
MVSKIIARGYLGQLFFLLGFDEEIIVLELFIFGVSPKVNLVSSNSGKLKEFAFACNLENGNIIELVQGVAGGLKLSQLEVPDTHSTLSEVSY